MYSPRSVSIGAMPSASRCSLSADLLGHHRLRLGDGPRAHAAAELGDDAPRVGGGRRPMDVAAQRQHLALELLEVEIEVGQRVVLDVARAVAQRLELGQPLGRLAAALGEAHLQLGERILQVGVGQGRADILLEVVGGRFHQPAPGSRGARRWRQIPPMPASTSATWRTRIGAAFALQLARHVHQAAEVAGQQRVGAGAGDIGRFLANHGIRYFRVLHAEGAAEAAADLGRLHLAQREPLHRAPAAGAAAP